MQKQFINACYVHHLFIMYKQKKLGYFQKWATDGLQIMIKTLQVFFYMIQIDF